MTEKKEGGSLKKKADVESRTNLLPNHYNNRLSNKDEPS